MLQKKKKKKKTQEIESNNIGDGKVKPALLIITRKN
jgi:hypothetical protein